MANDLRLHEDCYQCTKNITEGAWSKIPEGYGQNAASYQGYGMSEPRTLCSAHQTEHYSMPEATIATAVHN